MKKIFFSALLSVIALSSFAQGEGYKKAVDKIAESYSISTVTFSRESVQLLYMFDIDNKDNVKVIIDNVESIKIASHKTSDPEFTDVALKAFTENGYTQVDIKDIVGTRNVKLVVDKDASKVSEAHILAVQNGKGAIFSLIGEFKQKDIKKFLDNGKKE